MNFINAADAATEPAQPIPLSHYPVWYARIRYWLNYAHSGTGKTTYDPLLKEVQRERLSASRDYQELMRTALRHGLIENPIEEPMMRDVHLGMGSENYAAQRREADIAYKQDLVDWFNRLDQIMRQLSPHVAAQKSRFAANLELLGEVHELTPLEREIFALLSSDKLARFIAYKAHEDDNEESSYAEMVARCLGMQRNDESAQAKEEEETAAEQVAQALFQSGTLIDAQLLHPVESHLANEFYADEDTLDLLETRDLTKDRIFAKIIGTLAEKELSFDEDFDYLDFRDEMRDSMLGMLSRQSTQGKVYFLAGSPGAGKSALPATIAAHIETIMRKKNPDYTLPVYVIGIDEDAGDDGAAAGPGKKRRGKSWARTSDEEGGGRNYAKDRDARRLLRARRTLKKMNIPAILVVEEADGILATLVSEEGSAMTRAMRSQILDHSPVVTILISNHPNKFDASANRRIIKYTMATPPAEKRANMVVKMSQKFGLGVSRKDAVTLGKQYIFTPGNIKSALQYMADILAGERLRGVRRSAQVSYAELVTAFRRKAVTMAGTTVKLDESVETPAKIDPKIYFTEDLSPAELGNLIKGKSPARLWLLCGLPETEVTSLATHAASRGGECEVIQIGGYNSNILEQMETAKRNKTPLVMTGFANVINGVHAEALRTHPLMIAAQDHVDSGYSVYFVSDHVPAETPPALRAIFGDRRRGYAGFNLAAGYDLLTVIGGIAGLKIPAAARALFNEAARPATQRQSRKHGRGGMKNALTLDFVDNEDATGILIAGPKDVRIALQNLKDEGREISFPNIFSSLRRQGVVCTLKRDDIKRLTGLRPASMDIGDPH